MKTMKSRAQKKIQTQIENIQGEKKALYMQCYLHKQE